ncbi:MAG TPA: HlyD family type I secretion periplasmic adaptor subunit [Thermosynechococcaceae cyanobacterium]
MKVSISSTPAQSRQIKQQLANPKESLSYELGKAVQELPPLYTRLLAGGISALVFGTIAWAHFSKIDEVAIAQGQLIPSAEVRPIRAGSVGSIQQINVKEGDQIRKGQVMVVMDSALPQTEVARLTQASKLIREDIARLQAERTGSANAGTQVQDQLLQARLGEFDRKRAAAIDEAQRQLSARDEALATLSRLQANLINARDGLANANIREQALSSLKGSGAVPQLDYIRAQDEVTQAKDRVVSYEKEINVQGEKIRQAEAAYSSAQNTATGLVSQRQSEILTQFTKRQEEQASIDGQLAQAKKQQERETITAPFDGTVYNVKATRGPVQTGEELVSIVPKDENIVLEVKILNRDIGFIKEGMRAKVKLAAFSYQEFGIVEGKVIGVSPNAIVEKDVGLVFPTRVRLNKRAVDVRGQSVNFTPGMQATAEIVTRKKSVLDFMIEPITRRFSEAFSVR